MLNPTEVEGAIRRFYADDDLFKRVAGAVRSDYPNAPPKEERQGKCFSCTECRGTMRGSDGVLMVHCLWSDEKILPKDTCHTYFEGSPQEEVEHDSPGRVNQEWRKVAREGYERARCGQQRAYRQNAA